MIDHVGSATTATSAQPMLWLSEVSFAFPLPLAGIPTRVSCRTATVSIRLGTLPTDTDGITRDAIATHTDTGCTNGHQLGTSAIVVTVRSPRALKRRRVAALGFAVVGLSFALVPNMAPSISTRP